MKVIIEECDVAEDQVIIRCKEVNDDLLKLVSYIKAKRQFVIGYKADNIYNIALEDAYYFEAVDSKVFLYCKKDVYESRQKLYELETELSHEGFIRISKSVVVNIRKLRSLCPAFNGRFEGALENGEKVIISRQYVPELRKKLGC